MLVVIRAFRTDRVPVGRLGDILAKCLTTVTEHACHNGQLSGLWSLRLFPAASRIQLLLHRYISLANIFCHCQGLLFWIMSFKIWFRVPTFSLEYLSIALCRLSIFEMYCVHSCLHWLSKEVLQSYVKLFTSSYPSRLCDSTNPLYVCKCCKIESQSLLNKSCWTGI